MNTSASFLRYRLELEPLTPIHIGSGQSFEGVDYAFRDGGAEEPSRIVCLDTNCFLGAMDNYQAKAFLKKLDQGQPLASWFRAQMGQKYDRYSIEVDPTTASELRRVVEDPAAEGEIHLLPRNEATGQIYLPGSSLKGAIRTAVVAAEAQRPERQNALKATAAEHRDKNRKFSADFEGVALGHGNGGRPNLYRDPFRQVMLSDLAAAAGATRIQRIRIIRSRADSRTGPDPGGIHIWREVTSGTTLGQQALFTGELRLAPALADRTMHSNDKNGKPTHVPLALPWAKIRRDCNEFYRERLIDELGKFLCESSVAERLRATVEDLADRECLVRLGRHSHFECVTVGKPYVELPRRGVGKTRSYAAGRVPLGWALLRLIEIAP